MKPFLVLTFLFQLTISKAQPKTHLELINDQTPTFLHCKDAVNKVNCYNDTFANLITTELNNQFNNTNQPDTTFKVTLFVFTNADGSTLVKKTETNHPQYLPAIQKACSNIPVVQPNYNQDKKQYTTSSTKFTLTFNVKNNLFTAQPSQFNPQGGNKELELSKILQYPKVNHCVATTNQQYKTCLLQQIKIELKNNTTKKQWDLIKSQDFIISISVNQKAEFYLDVLNTDQNTQNIIKNALSKLPILSPAFTAKGPYAISTTINFTKPI